MAEYADLELGLERHGAGGYAVELRLVLPGSDADVRTRVEGVGIPVAALRQLTTDPRAYGHRLGQELFAHPDVREVFAKARALESLLRVRLVVGPTAPELHGLRWETLTDPEQPESGVPLLLGERVLFSRYASSPDWRRVAPRAKGELQALVAVANPANLARYAPGGQALAPIDVPAEVARATTGLAGIAATVLGEVDRASLGNIVERLLGGLDILYLVCHGALIGGDPHLWLEDDAGNVAVTAGAELVTRLRELAQPPRLVVLVSCQSAGTGEGEALGALGPQLGQAGIPAVLAMQGNVSMTTVEAFMPVFFREVQRDGQIDRAVALARGAVRDRHDAWAPVLYMRLKSGRLWSEPGPTAGAPLPDRDRPSHTFPAQPTPLIGREAELASLHQLLTAPEPRLITLTGPGGIGKTRLAIQAAADAVVAFPDGVWWVPLAALTDPGLVVQAMASAVGVGEVAGEPLLETLGQQLRPRQTLLLLDNLEQVIAAAPLIASLLETAPGVRVLATSRAPLRIRAEQEVPVAPLALPAERPGEVALPAAAASPAVQLFVARAQAVKPAFTLDERTAAAVGAICRRLDGLPLAIELAAARVRILPPDQLLNRLDERLQLLTGGSRDLPARQQTLRATIAWSHDLLDAEEQMLFARLSVFAGGCTFEAAEAVCAAAGDLGIEMLDGLEALVEQSLLRQGEGPDGEVRFAMLETIREYGLEHLEAMPDAETVRRAHAAFFLNLAEEAEQYLAGPEQVGWLDRLGAEHDNLRAALGWLDHAGARELEVRLAVALWRFWWVRGHLSEGRTWLERALAGGAEAPPAVRERALSAAGVLAESQGDYERAAPLHEAALVLSRQLGDREAIGNSLANLAIMAHDQGDYNRATELHEQELALWREIEDEAGIASSLYYLGRVALSRGDDASASVLLEQSLGMFRKLDHKAGQGAGLESLGSLAFYREDYARAAALYGESLSIWRELGDRRMIGYELANVGEAIQHQGDLTRAEALYQEALAINRELGEKRATAYALGQLAKVSQARGDYIQAAELFTKSLVLRRQVGEKPATIESLEGLAALACLLGEASLGARLFGAAEALRKSIGAPRPPAYRAEYERHVAVARTALGEAAFAEAWATGQALSLDQAIAEAACVTV